MRYSNNLYLVDKYVILKSAAFHWLYTRMWTDAKNPPYFLMSKPNVNSFIKRK